MQWSFDRTGFPLLEIRPLGLSWHLLPVTKWQFERFMADTEGFDDAWYEAVLGGNPRRSVRNFSGERREELFITGVLRDEAEKYARWSGPGFRLPGVDEWRRASEWLNAEMADQRELEDLLRKCSNATATTILQQLADALSGQTLDPSRREYARRGSWLEFSLMCGGLVEWVGAEAGLGKPRGEFHPNTFNPFTSLVENPNRRLRFFGLRLVRPLRH